MVIVRKKDTSARFCIDYRKLNAVTRKDSYPLPTIDNTLDTIAGLQWLSNIRLSGYWHIEVANDDHAITAHDPQVREVFLKAPTYCISKMH